MERGTVSMDRFEEGNDVPADIIGGAEFCEEPPVLRFFGGRMKPKGRNWGAALAGVLAKAFGQGS